MSAKVTNNTDISLPLAVWLLEDDYDYNYDPNYISATGLMAPLRHIVLRGRPTLSNEPPHLPDVEEFIARALGKTIHKAIELAWLNNPSQALIALGHPAKLIENLRVNPDPAEMAAFPQYIPVYLEQRLTAPLAGYTVGGKFDLITDGTLQDVKSTSTFVWMKGEEREEQYQLQGSIYRWLDAQQPHQRIQDDFIRINFVFTDWNKGEAKRNPDYPQSRIKYKDVPLMSLKETQHWMETKLALIRKYRRAPENQIPECSDEELWRTDPLWKYYANPDKTDGRSTKNFDNASDAHQFMQVEKKGKGVVIFVDGEPKRCNYCPVFHSCSQKDKYFSS